MDRMDPPLRHFVWMKYEINIKLTTLLIHVLQSSFIFIPWNRPPIYLQRKSVYLHYLTLPCMKLWPIFCKHFQIHSWINIIVFCFMSLWVFFLVNLLKYARTGPAMARCRTGIDPLPMLRVWYSWWRIKPLFYHESHERLGRRLNAWLQLSWRQPYHYTVGIHGTAWLSWNTDQCQNSPVGYHTSLLINKLNPCPQPQYVWLNINHTKQNAIQIQEWTWK